MREYAEGKEKRGKKGYRAGIIKPLTTPHSYNNLKLKQRTREEGRIS